MDITQITIFIQYRGIKSFSFLCWMLCSMGQKVSTKSLMTILSDCFPSSSCLLYANIGNNINIRIEETKKWLPFKTWCSLSVPRCTAHHKGNWNSWCLYRLLDPVFVLRSVGNSDTISTPELFSFGHEWARKELWGTPKQASFSLVFAKKRRREPTTIVI